MLKVTTRIENLQRVLSAINKLNSTVPRVVEVKLPKFLAERFRFHIIESIANQKYSNYPETSTPGRIRYKEWKMLTTNRDKYWDLFGDLLKKFRVSVVENGFFSGIQSTVMDRGGKSWFGLGNRGPSKPIAWYGWIMEEGGDYGRGGVHPARPLFEPALDYFSTSLVPGLSYPMVEMIERTWS